MYSGVLVLFLAFLVCQPLPFRDVYTNHWALRISGGREEADELASKYGYKNLGQVRELIYLEVKLFGSDNRDCRL